MSASRAIRCFLLGLGMLLVQPYPALAQQGIWAQAVQMMRTNQPQGALPLLEKLVSAQPQKKEYRFELAYALFLLGKDFRARWHLEQVRGADLTSQETHLVGRLLSEIAARAVWSGSFSIALKPETNVSRKTSVGSINIGGLDFTLTPNSRAKPGVSAVVTAGLGYSPRLTERVKASFSVLTHLKHNKDQTLRDYLIIGREGLQFFPDARSSISGGLQQGYRWVGDKPYSSSVGIWADYTQLVGARGRLNFGADLSRTEHKVALPDSRRKAVTASYSHALTANAQATLSGFLENTKGSLPNLVGKRTALSVSAVYAWHGGLMTSATLTHQTDRRRGPEPIFGVTRSDQSTALELGIYHRSFQIGPFAPTFNIGIEKNRSNIPLAQYDNKYMSIGLTRNF